MTPEEAKKRYPQCPQIGTFLRNKETGDLAQVVLHEEDIKIKPDLPGSPVYYPATQAHRFNVETNHKKMPPGSWARIAYEADRALCDIHTDLKRQPDWLSLKAHERAKWIEAKVNLGHPLRIELYTAVIKVLESSGE
jgi:hypothetical protein